MCGRACGVPGAPPSPPPVDYSTPDAMSGFILASASSIPDGSLASAAEGGRSLHPAWPAEVGGAGVQRCALSPTTGEGFPGRGETGTRLNQVPTDPEASQEGPGPGKATQAWRRFRNENTLLPRGTPASPLVGPQVLGIKAHFSPGLPARPGGPPLAHPQMGRKHRLCARHLGGLQGRGRRGEKEIRNQKPKNKITDSDSCPWETERGCHSE